MSSFLLLVRVVVVVTLVTGAETSEVGCEEIPYNSTYPLTEPVKGNGETKYRIAIVADYDKLSKVEGGDNKWKSTIKKGWLVLGDRPEGEIKVNRIEWDYELDIFSYLNEDGQGMELTELKVFNAKLYTCDEKTGIVYELEEDNPHPVPFVRLNDGNGRNQQAFKCQWMTVKDNLLWVGSMGMEWVEKDGTPTNNAFWVKKIDAKGSVHSEYFYDQYDAIRKSYDFGFPGFLYHGAINWSELKQKWYILPWLGYNQKYDEAKNKHRHIFRLFITEDFTNLRHLQVGEPTSFQDFSAFKFIPGLKDNFFVALKTLDYQSTYKTHIAVYSVDGNIESKLKLVSESKFEGLEFV